ncbi:type II toxin-antitoxin system Phd/YefM family antitoxin [Cupriavidus cauae]|jgi:prevent-host-death family protein|uniref:Antitoxin n=1 Tax=Cupriavidus cauae TaxID=2608999 RepID=A0A5M8ATM4_9BURK|nr:type II toxin-antitoxin system prevent-host-death family antitoxin [Cupriavidus cauae]KAA0183069.1 type II toxin-antitoxin system prevent-host-death family antitoxin [Cupriavidus gilardii]KAA6126189.1 type II toxin-antitoxin system prevent-host-death family antitoxin [Cupriavidus cauae]
MRTINIDEASADLPHLVEMAAQGESFVIAKGGKPMVRVVPVHATHRSGEKRIGILQDRFEVPEDFDRLCSDEIEVLFTGRI